MQIAIIGLPMSGKTTLFDALTGVQEQAGAYAAPGSVHHGMVPVVDERVDFLADIFHPKKRSYAQVEFLDIGGLFTGEKPPVEAVEAMRGADGLVKVVRAFESEAVPHQKGSVDPKRDLEEMESDLFVVDLDIIERRIEKLKESVTKPTPEREEQQEELALLQRCREQLDTVGALEHLELKPAEEKMLRGFTFLTQKSGIVVLNIGEDQLGEEDAAAAALAEAHEPVVPVCAEIEKEILALDPDERTPFLEDLGLEELSAQKVAHSILESLDLISFFTANEKELRAWLIRRGATAIEAAGKVHTDLARGFIRAEVTPAAALREHGSMKEVRAHGKEQLEGKDYVVEDGDILQVRFSV